MLKFRFTAGPIAQWWSRGLIILWLQVRILLGPPFIAMKVLKDKILKLGRVKNGDVLKVDEFLNHQIDTKLLDKIADEFIKRFKGVKFTKVLTIETSGIAVAYPVAQKLGVPLVFAKKKDSVNIDGDKYSSKVISYTNFREYDETVSKKFLSDKDKVLIVDDFLANGSSLRGLLSICQQAGCKIEGIGIVIEKSYKVAAKELRDEGYRVESLVKIINIDEKTNKIEFGE